MIPAGSFTWQVLMDFSGTAYGSTAFTWTDVTPWVITSPQTPASAPVDLRWGKRAYQDDATSPSTVSFTLKNESGQFTPGNSGSPYYPHVRRRVPVRLVAAISSVPVYVITGYADSVTAVPRNGGYWTTRVVVTDILGRMGDDTPLRGYYIEEVMADSPSAFFTMQEPADSQSFADLTGAAPPLGVASSKAGASPVVSGESVDGLSGLTMVGLTNGSALTWTYGTAAGSWLVGSPLNPSLSFTVSMLVAPLLPLTASSLFDSAVNLGPYTMSLLLAHDGTLSLSFRNVDSSVMSPLSTSTAVGKVNLTDGLPHYVAVTYTLVPGTPMTTVLGLWVDGLLVASDTGTALPVTFGRFDFTVGMSRSGGSGWHSVSPGNPLSAAVAGIALFPQALSGARLTAHYQAALTAFSGEGTQPRVQRLLTYRPNLGSSFPDATYYGVMGSDDCTGKTMAAALLEAGDVEGGPLYADGRGRITLRSRSHLYNPTASLTLDAAQGEVSVDTDITSDAMDLVNVAQFSRPGGATQVVTNMASEAEAGLANLTRSLNVDTDANALAAAQWAVAMGTQDPVALQDLAVDLYTVSSTATALAVLQLAQLDVAAAVDLPTQFCAATYTRMVVGGSLSITTETCLVALSTAPLPPKVLTLDPSPAQVADGDTLDGSYVLAY